MGLVFVCLIVMLYSFAINTLYNHAKGVLFCKYERRYLSLSTKGFWLTRAIPSTRDLYPE
jgi:hypothetical protein